MSLLTSEKWVLSLATLLTYKIKLILNILAFEQFAVQWMLNDTWPVPLMSPFRGETRQAVNGRFIEQTTHCLWLGFWLWATAIYLCFVPPILTLFWGWSTHFKAHLSHLQRFTLPENSFLDLHWQMPIACQFPFHFANYSMQTVRLATQASKQVFSRRQWQQPMVGFLRTLLYLSNFA